MHPTSIEHHPAAFDYRARFPDAHLVAGGEGGAWYAASDGADAILIGDEGTMLGMLSDEDAADLAACAISVRRFASAAERDAFLRARRPRAR